MDIVRCESLGRVVLETKLHEWQRILGLEGWTIRLEFVTFARPWQSGDIKIDTEARLALLLLAEKPFRDEEAVMVHELVHLLLWPLDRVAMDLTEVTGVEGSAARVFAETAVFRALEPVTEQLTLALLRARGVTPTEAWGILEAEALERTEQQT